MTRTRRCLGAVVLLATAILSGDRHLSAPALAAGHPYRYIIGKPRLPGIADDALSERQALLRTLQGERIEADIEIGDRCDTEECDVVNIVETDDKTFKVNFFPKAAALANKDHLEKETRRQPYDTQALIWQQGSKEIARMIAIHHAVHLSSTLKNTP
jgi:hypothetical protein